MSQLVVQQVILVGDVESNAAQQAGLEVFRQAIAKNQDQSPVPPQILRIDSQATEDSIPLLLQPDAWICPFTLDVPQWLAFPARELFQTCADLATLRHCVQDWGYATGEGVLWLPIALTARGPLYGEVIGDAALVQQSPNFEAIGAQDAAKTKWQYVQPVHLRDRLRQPLYRLGQTLLQHLQAPPAVYLLQFGIADQAIYFDRLYPFPFTPAIASVGVQAPDLFTAHWHCLTRQPVHDLSIPTPEHYVVYQQN